MMIHKTMRTMNAQLVTPNMKKRRQKVYPPLTREQQALVESHQWISGRLAYGARCLTGGHTGSLTHEDLESIANFALCVAATRYEPDKQVKFSTYAWRTARGYIQHALRDYSRMVKTPRWVARYKEEVDRLLKEKKSYEEISEVLGIPVSKVMIVDMSTFNYHVSYDSSPEDWTTREFVFNDDDVKPYVVSPELLKALNSLSEAEFNILMKYVEGKDMSEEEMEWASDNFFHLQSVAHGNYGVEWLESTSN